MRPYPLIPEAGTYGVAILIILSLSAFSLASHIHFRLQQPGIPFLAVYCPVLSLIAFWGAVVLDPALWFDGGIRGWLFAVSTGPLLGVTAAWADRRIIRPIERKRALSWRARFKPVPSDVWNSFGSVRIYGDSKRRRVPLRKMQHPGAGSGIGAHNLSLTVVILAGALEEILYRGVLVQLCFLLPSTILIAAALCASVIMFGLSHIEFGWAQVCSKLPLGVLALLGTLATGNIFCAMITHSFFNLCIVLKQREDRIIHDDRRTLA